MIVLRFSRVGDQGVVHETQLDASYSLEEAMRHVNAHMEAEAPVLRFALAEQGILQLDLVELQLLTLMEK